jgi:hypothetical protein
MLAQWSLSEVEWLAGAVREALFDGSSTDGGAGARDGPSLTVPPVDWASLTHLPGTETRRAMVERESIRAHPLVALAAAGFRREWIIDVDFLVSPEPWLVVACTWEALGQATALARSITTPSGVVACPGALHGCHLRVWAIPDKIGWVDM